MEMLYLFFQGLRAPIKKIIKLFIAILTSILSHFQYAQIQIPTVLAGPTLDNVKPTELGCWTTVERAVINVEVRVAT